MSNFANQCKDQFKAFILFSKEWLSDTWVLVKDIWQFLLIGVLIVVAVIWITNPVPEGKVYLATGPIDSASDNLGKKYKEYFKGQGVILELVQTNGSVENVDLLEDKKSKVMAAFVTSGTINEELKDVKTLGSIDYQPLWCFFQKEKAPTTGNMTQGIKDKTINIGPKSSGTYALLSKVLKLNGIDPNSEQFKNLKNEDAIKALKNKEVDAACMVDSLESKSIQTLKNVEDIDLVGNIKGEIYARLIPGLTALKLPEGGFDVKTNQPPREITINATHTEILVNERLHPAIQTLFLLAARNINSKSSFFANAGEFPSSNNSNQPLSEEATIFYKKGAPPLMDHFPFWIADLIHRFALKVLPFLIVAYPFVKSFPNYQKKVVSAKMAKLYGELKLFEQELTASYDVKKKNEYQKKIDEMDKKAQKMKIVPTTESDYYTLRSSIDFVRNCIERDAYL